MQLLQATELPVTHHEMIARVCHESIRAFILHFGEDPSQAGTNWDECDEERKTVTRSTVMEVWKDLDSKPEPTHTETEQFFESLFIATCQNLFYGLGLVKPAPKPEPKPASNIIPFGYPDLPEVDSLESPTLLTGIRPSRKWQGRDN